MRLSKPITIKHIETGKEKIFWSYKQAVKYIKLNGEFEWTLNYSKN